MKEKNTRMKKMTQKIMIFLAVMICVGMISAVTTTAVRMNSWKKKVIFALN